jgi:hypothetical protein
MGGTMTGPAHGGLPVLIPGAWERRVGRPPTRPANTTAEPATPHNRAATVGDRERLEHEREGGGAPSERTGGQHRTILARVYDFLMGA